jgi:hypothetical protein
MFLIFAAAAKSVKARRVEDLKVRMHTARIETFADSNF